MATAKRLPSGAWRVQVYAGKDASGKRQYLSFTQPTKKAAEYEALQWQLHYKEISRDSSAMTVAEAMDKYIASKDSILSPSTIRGYTIIRRNRFQNLMTVKLNRLTNAQIQEAVNDLSKTVSPKSVRNSYGLLSAVLTEYHPGLNLNITLPQKRCAEQKVLEPDQISILLKAVEDTDMEIPVLLALWMCMRSSEITGLTWDCVDFQRKTVTIKQARVQNKENKWVYKDTTKNTSSTRTLVVPDYILGRLAAAREASTSDHVVNHTGNGIYQRLKSILRRSGLPDIRFHDLRHTAASVMVLLNIPTLYAQKRGGWSGPQTMEQVYQHTMGSRQSTVDQEIDNFYSSLL